MIDTGKIVAIAEQELEGTDMFVVECTNSNRDDIELIVDSDTSVSIDSCTKLCRAIEEHFNRDEEDFALTVASAGIGYELKSVRQYHKLVGKSIEVLLRTGIKVLAKLDEVSEVGITISYQEMQQVEGKKRKQPVDVTINYSFDEIKHTKELLEFK